MRKHVTLCCVAPLILLALVLVCTGCGKAESVSKKTVVGEWHLMKEFIQNRILKSDGTFTSTDRTIYSDLDDANGTYTISGDVVTLTFTNPSGHIIRTTITDKGMGMRDTDGREWNKQP